MAIVRPYIDWDRWAGPSWVDEYLPIPSYRIDSFGLIQGQTATYGIHKRYCVATGMCGTDAYTREWDRDPANRYP